MPPVVFGVESLLTSLAQKIIDDESFKAVIESAIQNSLLEAFNKPSFRNSIEEAISCEFEKIISTNVSSSDIQALRQSKNPKISIDRVDSPPKPIRRQTYAKVPSPKNVSFQDEPEEIEVDEEEVQVRKPGPGRQKKIPPAHPPKLRSPPPFIHSTTIKQPLESAPTRKGGRQLKQTSSLDFGEAPAPRRGRKAALQEVEQVEEDPAPVLPPTKRAGKAAATKQAAKKADDLDISVDNPTPYMKMLIEKRQSKVLEEQTKAASAASKRKPSMDITTSKIVRKKRR